jgi:hypothetical protein
MPEPPSRLATTDKYRTNYERKLVVTAPMAFELAAAAKAIVDLLKKIPIQFREAAVQAVVAVILGIQEMIDMFIQRLPGESDPGRSQRIAVHARGLREQIKNLPLDQSAPVIKQAVKFVDLVESMTGSPESFAIDVPHFFTEQTVRHQVSLVIQYIEENAMK